jgi:ABC transport permease subunit
LTNVFELAGKVSLFGLRAAIDSFRRPLEGGQIVRQLGEIGSKSLPLVIASGFALGAVMTLHTRSTLVMFGASSIIPTVQALAFFLEIGPLVTGLLVAGRVGSGIGAVLADMRATEQIDGIESLSIDSFKFLVVPRIIACTLALPLLTLFMDFSGLAGGFLSEFATSRLSLQLYSLRAFSNKMGTGTSERRISRATSKPSIPGSMTSKATTSKSPSRAMRSPSGPVRATWTAHCRSTRARLSRSAMFRSSSTTRTRTDPPGSNFPAGSAGTQAHRQNCTVRT